MELVAMTGAIMPQGNPAFAIVRQFPTIAQLINEYGRKTMLKAIYLLVKDLCGSLNVVRNMNDDQMIEAAAMLLDECDNFRLEDYTMMFALGKRGHLVKIMDRVDIETIGKMLDVYYDRRKEAGYRLQQQEIEPAAWSKGAPSPETAEEKEMSERFGKIVGIMKSWEDKRDYEGERKKRMEKKQENEAKAREYAERMGVDFDELKKAFLL